MAVRTGRRTQAVEEGQHHHSHILPALYIPAIPLFPRYIYADSAPFPSAVRDLPSHGVREIHPYYVGSGRKFENFPPWPLLATCLSSTRVSRVLPTVWGTSPQPLGEAWVELRHGPEKA